MPRPDTAVGPARFMRAAYLAKGAEGRLPVALLDRGASLVTSTRDELAEHRFRKLIDHLRSPMSTRLKPNYRGHYGLLLLRTEGPGKPYLEA